MAVINNTLSEIGDILIVKAQLAIRGDLNLTGYTDSLEGENSNRFFNKSFKYSFDNLSWSEEKELNNQNIQEITGFVPGLLFIEIFYERGGSDVTGLLEFNSIEIQGDIDIQIVENTDTLESILANFSYDNSFTSSITNNLLRKIYFNGILPQYIERGQGGDDDDFISLWTSICFYFAMIINFQNSFEKILLNRNNLSEFLKQKNFLFCEEETTMEDLQFLANNLKDEIRKRGTIQVVREKGEINSFGEKTKIRGELLRLICKNIYDEFLFEVLEKKNKATFVNNSSFLYNGTNRSNQLNKAKKLKNLNSYEFFGSVFLNNEELEISGGTNGSGLGFNENDSLLTELNEKFEIIVDKEIDYEVTFQIKKEVNVLPNKNLNFAVFGYNRNNIFQNNSFLKIGPNQTVENYFFKDIQIDEIAKVKDVWYNVRGIIYAERSETLNSSDSRNNLNFGNNLIFNRRNDVEKIMVCIYTDSNDPLSSFKIKDFSLRPLIRGKNILRKIEEFDIGGLEEAINLIPAFSDPYVLNPKFLQQGNLIYSYLKNNSDDLDRESIANKIEKFLIPYQQKFIGIFMESKINDKQLLT